MRLSSLKNWAKLSEEERRRIEEIYGRSPDLEQSLHDTEPESLRKAMKDPYNNAVFGGNDGEN